MKAVNYPFEVVAAGYILKDLGNLRGPTILLAICKEYNLAAQHKPVEIKCTIKGKLLQAIMDRYSVWVEKIEKALIWEADKITPFFNGKKLAELFKVGTGEVVKHLNNHQFSWQLMNPTKTKENYAIYVAGNREAILSELSIKK